MKTHKHLYERICAFENVHRAYIKARRGKRYKADAIRFSLDLEANLINIQNHLIWKSYQPGPYRFFMVREPKERLIAALPFFDRVVHHCLCNVIEPIFERTFIRDSYACRTGAGVLAGVLRTTQFLRDATRRWGAVYCLKGDVAKYFYSVDHATLKALIRRKIACPDTLALIDRIIDSPGDRVGMPIGNLTSQLFANVYLSALDHYVKDELRVRYYVRYMDDFVLFHPDKAFLSATMERIDGLLRDRLRLTLNGKTSIFPVGRRCVVYLGYRMWPQHKLLRKSNLRRTRRKFRKYARLYREGLVDLDAIRPRIASWLGHAKHADTWHIRRQVLGETVFSRPSPETGR